DLLTVWARAIDNRRNLVVRAYLEEIRLELIAPADMDGLHGIVQATFLEHDVNLVAVRRRPGVDVDHSLISSCSEAAGMTGERPSSAWRGSLSARSIHGTLYRA